MAGAYFSAAWDNGNKNKNKNKIKNTKHVPPYLDFTLLPLGAAISALVMWGV